jgi:S-adenosylmethionine:tRNA-ribosyltransferase-isomerase (queuine synthetase)
MNSYEVDVDTAYVGHVRTYRKEVSVLKRQVAAVHYRHSDGQAVLRIGIFAVRRPGLETRAIQEQCISQSSDTPSQCLHCGYSWRRVARQIPNIS